MSDLGLVSIIAVIPRINLNTSRPRPNRTLIRSRTRRAIKLMRHKISIMARANKVLRQRMRPIREFSRYANMRFANEFQKLTRRVLRVNLGFLFGEHLLFDEELS